MIQVLHEWKGLEDVFEREFDSVPPDERHAALVTIKDGETSFLVVENVTLVYQIYVAPEHRGNGVAQKLIRHVEERVPNGQSILCIASSYRRRNRTRLTLWGVLPWALPEGIE